MRINEWGLAITEPDNNPQETDGFGGARGALTEEVLSNIISDNERVRAAFTSPGGLTRIAGDEERHVTFTVVMIVTDRRILFVSGDASGDIGSSSGSLPYDDIAAVGIDRGETDVLALSMANGVRWEFPVPDADPEVVDSVLRHLRWVGVLRSRLVSCRNDVELAAGEIREHAGAMEWEKAEAAYDTVRSTLDELICAVQWTEPIPDEVIAPELTEMERTLERAYARLFIERAESQLELGRQLVENGDYDQARSVVDAAQRYHQRATERADAVERGDSFRFGEQRELRDDLDRLGWEIESVAAEPLEQAHEAKVRAMNAENPAAAVGDWETAFRRYGSVLTLEWGNDDRQFAGDTEEVRAELHASADRLVECHRELARDEWETGTDRERDGDIKGALRAWSDAVAHMERASDLAAEFRPEDADEIERRRGRMAETLRAMRDTATVERETQIVTDESEEAAENEDDLLDIDAHQEITFDMSIEEQTADGGRRHDRYGTDTQPQEGTQDEGLSAETAIGDESDRENETRFDLSDQPTEEIVESYETLIKAAQADAEHDDGLDDIKEMWRASDEDDETYETAIRRNRSGDE